MNTMYRLRWLPFLAGLLILIAGFVYGIYVGTPYLDPTPEMHARWLYRLAISDTLSKTGGIVLAAGLVYAVVVNLLYRKKR